MAILIGMILQTGSSASVDINKIDSYFPDAGTLAKDKQEDL
jgi:hypothetical protein